VKGRYSVLLQFLVSDDFFYSFVFIFRDIHVFHF